MSERLMTARPSVDDVKAHLTQLLEELGRTNDEVAGSLEQRGYRGEQESCSGCPVATMLFLSDLRPYAVLVGEEEVSVYMTPAQMEPINVDLPAAVAQFVTAFDNGAYPRLVKTTGSAA